MHAGWRNVNLVSSVKWQTQPVSTLTILDPTIKAIESAEASLQLRKVRLRNLRARSALAKAVNAQINNASYHSPNGCNAVDIAAELETQTLVPVIMRDKLDTNATLAPTVQAQARVAFMKFAFKCKIFIRDKRIAKLKQDVAHQ